MMDGCVVECGCVIDWQHCAACEAAARELYGGEMPLKTEVYTHEEYLDVWVGLFEDAEEGEYGYYSGNAYVSYTVCKLTEEQFAGHLAALEQAYEDYDAAYEAGDAKAANAALEKALEHELALLI